MILNNTLVIYNSKTLQQNKTAFLTAIEKNLGLKQHDMEPLPDGYTFLFDDSYDSYIEVNFCETETQRVIIIRGKHADEVIGAYQMFINELN